MNKYELLKDGTIEIAGKTLYRIRAVRHFGNILKGSLGGYVESEENLSHEGNCWVFGEAKVYGKAMVYGNAEVCSEAIVHGEARVWGEARVYDSAKISDEARVYGEAMVFGKAIVYGQAGIYGKARVFGNAEVHGKAKVYGEAWVHGEARVYGEAEVTKDIINIIGLRYKVTITDNHMIIGCKCYTFEEWRGFTNEEISAMDEGALEFWERYKDALLTLCEAKEQI